jgi:hypothetical protein
MDRKFCVLIYSQYSSASKSLIEYIRALPYDFARITGMTFLAADNQSVRDCLLRQNITTVPAIVVQYFDGKFQVFENDAVYKFISVIVASMTPPQPVQPPIEDPLPVAPKQQDIMAIAMAMKESRDKNEPETGMKKTSLFKD